MSSVVQSHASRRLRDVLGEYRERLQQLFDLYGAENPRLCGSVARGTATDASDIDILVDMDPADGNVLMRASGLAEEVRGLLAGVTVDIFPEQLLSREVSASVRLDAEAL
ncbi:nucleotidyltransferase domain-containing protein [Corynebacterium sp. TA-R-1]|uniref:Nucleotidyltransferase domain-containing protein n=1 Tax=Corynebacterium stercoris TaxID=2943490 RepID=A0ABT1G5M8_9CORY|nr:nucleotidyltransferase domain-containing protein [Corynebacterium stercoris]MCP1388022.1 nucleotidyltransferase domain-containing protein [Corynebacterium stercoris]